MMVVCFNLFLTSRWGLVLWCEDNKAKALVVSALQSNVKALWPRGLNRLDGVRKLGTRHLRRAVDQGGRYLLGLLTALLLSINIWQMTVHRNMRACLQQRIWGSSSQLFTKWHQSGNNTVWLFIERTGSAQMENDITIRHFHQEDNTNVYFEKGSIRFTWHEFQSMNNYWSKCSQFVILVTHE